MKSLWFFKSRKLCSIVKSLKLTADSGLTPKCFRQHPLACVAWDMLIPECSRCVQNQGCREVSWCNTGKCWHKHFGFVTHSLSLGFCTFPTYSVHYTFRDLQLLTDSLWLPRSVIWPVVKETGIYRRWGQMHSSEYSVIKMNENQKAGILK